MRKHLRDGAELDSGTLFNTDRLRALREANIPQEDRDVTILLGNVPCGNCERFIKTVNGLAGLEIHVQPITVLSDRDPGTAKANRDEADRRRDTERQAEAGDETLPIADDTECEEDMGATIHPRPHRTAVGKMGPSQGSSIGKPATPITFEEYQRLQGNVGRPLNSLGN